MRTTPKLALGLETLKALTPEEAAQVAGALACTYTVYEGCTTSQNTVCTTTGSTW